ncbi:MAG: TolC family protein [Leptospiraceae bacterium]|nr:TolC family protein [Leptospiraceae bacterium]MDW7975295.1 TolC family protein [Leptospiraceae bacterium]
MKFFHSFSFLIFFLFFFHLISCKSINQKLETNANEKEKGNTNEITTLHSDEKKESKDFPQKEIETIIAKLKDKKDQKLSLNEVVQIVVYNSNPVKLQKLEIIKSDTDLKKDEGKYAPVLDFKFQSYERIDKQLPQSLFQGTKINQDVYTLGIQKLFESGTFLRLEGSDTRFDSNAGEGPVALTNPFFQQLRQPPLHTAAIKVIFQQDLLKNAFGYSQKRLKEIAKKKSLVQREQLEFQLAGLIVKTIVDYWSLAIAEIELKTAQGLLNNVNTIRNITYQKLNFGLAEPFEVNQWEALYNQAEIAVNTAKLERDTKRKELLRTLNLDPNIEITGSTELIKELPKDVDVQKDINYALQNRRDYRILLHSYEIARLSKELADNNLLPTVRIGGQYAIRDFGRYSSTAWDQVYLGKYPEKAIEFSVQYPLWDEAAKVDLRNAEITLKQLEIQKKELERQIQDEVELGFKQIQTAFDSLKKAEQAYLKTLNFYNGLLQGYRRGRFNVTAVKNALDALLQAEKGYNQALISYNITLVRYDLTRNILFEKYNINLDEILYQYSK